MREGEKRGEEKEREEKRREKRKKTKRMPSHISSSTSDRKINALSFLLFLYSSICYHNMDGKVSQVCRARETKEPPPPKV